MQNINFIKENVLKGKVQFGIWSIINSPMLIDVAAHAGLDFQILDMEHGVADFNVLDNCIRACEAVRCSPLIRVPGMNLSVIQSCLDMGAHGIIVPQINSYNEVLEVVRATRFAPEGVRGFNPFTRANGYNPKRPLHQTKLNNEFPLVSIIVETKGALKELDKILEIPELDMIYLGVYDLSFALGFNGNVLHPEIQDIVRTSIKKVSESGKLISLMANNPDEMKAYHNLGVKLIVCGVDSNIYLSAIESCLEKFRAQV